MPPHDFLQTFADRRQCFAELLDLSRRQTALVESDDYSQLLSVLGGKQRILGRLDEIGRGRPALWQAWRDQRDRLPAGLRRDCEQALAESERLLAELLEHERVSTEALLRRRDQTRRELQTVAAGSHVNHAYRDSLAPITHRHLDTDQ